MFHYIDRFGCLVDSSEELPDMIPLTEEEYQQELEKLKPSEEEIRAAKEAQLKALLAELYPAEE